MTVDAPRLLKAAARRDAVVRWARDAYRAALKPEAPEHTTASLRRVAEAAQADADAGKLEPVAETAAKVVAATVSDAPPKPKRGARGTRGLALFDDDGDIAHPDVFAADEDAGGTSDAEDPFPERSPPGSPMVKVKDRSRRRSGDAADAIANASASVLPNPDPTPLPAPTLAIAQPPKPDPKPPAGDEEEILFVVDVSAPQINFEGKDATGRFLIAAVDGRVVGLRARRPRIGSLSPKTPTGEGEEAHWGRREVRVTLKHAQAHVAPTDVDVNAGVQWLDESAFCGDATSPRSGSGSGSASGSGSSSGTKDAPGSGSTSGSSSRGPRNGGGGGVGVRSSSYLLRRVFEPCVMDLAFITHIPERARRADVGDDPVAAAADRVGSSSATASSSSSSSSASGRVRSRDGRRPEALTEFALRSPEIEAELDADQFAALVDVIGSVFLAQLEDPPPRPSAAAAALLAAEGRSLVEGEERASAAVVAGPLAAYKIARWRAAAARKDAADAEAREDARVPAGWSSRFGREGGRGGEGGGGGGSFGDTPLGGSVTPLGGGVTPPVEFAARSIRSRRVFAAVAALERAADDAESAVASAVASAEALVRPNRRRPAIKLSLAVDKFRWAMRAGGRAFLAAKISRLTLSRERHTDSSGMTKFVCAELALEIPPNKARAVPVRGGGGTDSASAPRPVLSRWDPDEPSGRAAPGSADAGADARRRRDKPLVRVHALRAASPPEAPIWDHIEVSVQPFDLRVEREMYDRVIAYLFPEKLGAAAAPDGAANARREAFGRGLAPGARFNSTGGVGGGSASGGGGTGGTGGTGGSGGSGGAERTAGGSVPAEPPSASTSTTSESDARRILLGSPPPRPTPGKRRGHVGAGARQGHARSKTWGADLFGVASRSAARDTKAGHARRGSGSGEPSAMDADAILDGLIQEQGERAAAAATTLGERVARPPALSLPATQESGAADGDIGFGGGFGGGGGGGGGSSSSSSSSSKTVVVRYLRVNDVLLRVSYDGAPRSFHEVRLLLDASTHAGFRGRWRELVDKLKGNVVWSVLKSVTGLQGRRLAGASLVASKTNKTSAGASAGAGTGTGTGTGRGRTKRRPRAFASEATTAKEPVAEPVADPVAETASASAATREGRPAAPSTTRTTTGSTTISPSRSAATRATTRNSTSSGVRRRRRWSRRATDWWSREVDRARAGPPCSAASSEARRRRRVKIRRRNDNEKRNEKRNGRENGSCRRGVGNGEGERRARGVMVGVDDDTAACVDGERRPYASRRRR